jgi:hypothetical protein
MKITTEEIRNGNHTGKTVWICHYNRPNLSNKALRNVPPTKAIICSNTDLPASKRIYYSENHFRPLNKKGEPMAKYISPVDNTGYRSTPGIELFVFTTEAECNAEWNNQLTECIKHIDVEIKDSAAAWIAQKDGLLAAFK